MWIFYDLSITKIRRVGYQFRNLHLNFSLSHYFKCEELKESRLLGRLEVKLAVCVSTNKQIRRQR